MKIQDFSQSGEKPLCVLTVSAAQLQALPIPKPLPTAGHERGLRSLSGTKSLLSSSRDLVYLPSALVILASFVACSLCLLVFPPNFPSFEHLQSILSLFLTCLSLCSNYG